MKFKDKALAVSLLQEKAINEMAYTYPEISRRTGYSKLQLIRIMKEIKEKKDTESIITHGNTGRKPATTASDQEVSYLREFKKPYPYITIAQFRDIYIEDGEFSDVIRKKGVTLYLILCLSAPFSKIISE